MGCCGSLDREKLGEDLKKLSSTLAIISGILSSIAILLTWKKE